MRRPGRGAQKGGSVSAGKVCVIGAGSSGLVAAKILQQAGLPFDCFELGSAIGGNWWQGNDNGRSAAYDSLHIDTSKDRMAFSDFPMPSEFPNYPHHSQVLEYFHRYAERFDLERRITFRTAVERVEALPEGGYRVTTSDRRTGDSGVGHYRAVLVCNGHHWAPKVPSFAESFSGRMLHSRDYRAANDLEGQRVLIVGIGNSGVDIACDLAGVAGRTLLATRRGAHVIPRWILGKPADFWVTPAGSRLPLALQRAIYAALIVLSRGRQGRYGVPKPATRLLAEHPTLSQNLLGLVRDGEIDIRPGIERVEGREVTFVDGGREQVDALICATGYRMSFPFLGDDLFDAESNRVSLYGRVVDPRHQGLYFIGLIQPLGAIMPLAELQARWVAGLLEGTLELPDRAEMRREIESYRSALERRYVASTRHTIQVDFFPYRRFLEARLRERVTGG